MNLIKSLLAIPFLFLILLALGGGLAYRDYTTWVEEVRQPMVDSIAAKGNEVKSLRAEVVRAQEFDKRRQEKLIQLQELARKLESTANAMPRSANVPDLLKSLADVADKAGIEFSSFRPQIERRMEFLVITPIDVQLKGNYVQIMSFLDASANLTRVVACEKLSLDGSTAPRGGVNILTAQMTLVTYHLEEELKTGIDTSRVPPASNGVPPPKKGG